MASLRQRVVEAFRASDPYEKPVHCTSGKDKVYRIGKCKDGRVGTVTMLDVEIPLSTRVLWDGEWCTWGDLSGNERTMCARNADGVMEGGSPF
jgi:hypothetical protein